MGIQEFRTKVLTLANKTELGDQAAKALTFRGLHSKDQDRIMIVNLIKTEQDLKKENYLERIIRFLRREEVRYQEETGKNTKRDITKSAI